MNYTYSIKDILKSKKAIRNHTIFSYNILSLFHSLSLSLSFSESSLSLSFVLFLLLLSCCYVGIFGPQFVSCPACLKLVQIVARPTYHSI
jgi:hypothetical protein